MRPASAGRPLALTSIEEGGNGESWVVSVSGVTIRPGPPPGASRREVKTLI